MECLSFLFKIHQSTTVIIRHGSGHSVKNIMNNIIEATILNQKFKGEDELLLHIPMITTDVPIELKCLQFKERITFVMTIKYTNKAQRQSLQVCGLDWRNSTHIDNCMWTTKVSENFLIYLCAYQKCIHKYLIKLIKKIIFIF